MSYKTFFQCVALGPRPLCPLASRQVDEVKLASANLRLPFPSRARHYRGNILSFFIGRLVFSTSSWRNSRKVRAGRVDGMFDGDSEDGVRAGGGLVHLSSCSSAMLGAVFQTFNHLLERSHLNSFNSREHNQYH